jgi:hypothetical protein
LEGRPVVGCGRSEITCCCAIGLEDENKVAVGVGGENQEH